MSFAFSLLYRLRCNFLCAYFGHVRKRGKIQDIIGFALIFQTRLFFYRVGLDRATKIIVTRTSATTTNVLSNKGTLK